MGEQMTEDEMGWVCGMHEGEDKCIQDFGGEHRKETILKMYL